MILYYTTGWNTLEYEKDLVKDVCEKIQVSCREQPKEAREEIIKHWFAFLEKDELRLDAEYHETFYVFDRKANKVDQFSVCLKPSYEIYNGKDEE